MNIRIKFNELRNNLSDPLKRKLLEEIESSYFDSLENLEQNFLMQLEIFESSHLEMCVEECLAARETWPNFHNRLKTIYFRMGIKKYKSHGKAAKNLGISRTTIGEHFRKTGQEIET